MRERERERERVELDNGKVDKDRKYREGKEVFKEEVPQEERKYM